MLAEPLTDLLLLSCVQEFSQSSIFRQGYGKNQHANSKPNAPMMHQEPSLYSLFPWSPSLPASSGTSHLESFKRRRGPGSQLSSDWQITPPQPANPLTHPTPAASRPHLPPTATELRPSPALAPSEHRTAGTAGSWTAGSPTRPVRVGRWFWAVTRSAPGPRSCFFCVAGSVSTLGLDYLPTSATSASSDNSWHQIGPSSSSWTNQESPMEESSVLLDSLKVGSPLLSSSGPDRVLVCDSAGSLQSIWSSSMMQPGPSALEQLLLQQKQKQQRGHGAMNPPH